MPATTSATLDGNEQYERSRASPAVAAHARDAGAAAAGGRHPLHRAADQARRGAGRRRSTRWRGERPLIIDESDGELESFPAAQRLGYRGVSSKNCKGFYKSLLNAARVAKLNAEAGAAVAFMSAEDLTTWAGVSVQQDLALVSLLGLTHVERNGHHFIDGMGFAPEASRPSFVAAASRSLRPRARAIRRASGSSRAGCARLARCPGFRGRRAPRIYAALQADGARTQDRHLTCHRESERMNAAAPCRTASTASRRSRIS